MKLRLRLLEKKKRLKKRKDGFKILKLHYYVKNYRWTEITAFGSSASWTSSETHLFISEKKKKKGKLTIKKLPCEKQADIFPSCSCSQRDIKASV